MIETKQGDFKLSPAYDLLNTKIHIDDTDFALKEELLPKVKTSGKIKDQFVLLGNEAEISAKTIEKIFANFTSNSDKVSSLTSRSFLN